MSDHPSLSPSVEEEKPTSKSYPWLASPSKGIDLPALLADRAAVLANLCPTRRESWQEKASSLPIPNVVSCKFDRPLVQIGLQHEWPGDPEHLRNVLQEMMPWKKGPFSFFGIEIDSEWRSDLKWSRLLPLLPELKNKRVADIGCHNGYFMYRMLPEDPELVIGFEPVWRHFQTFEFLQSYARQDRLHFELLGVESIHHFAKFFDVIFCLGILYHHTDPIGLLRKMRSSLAKGGSLLVDCQGIPGEESHALMPRGRYAGASGIWWLPTKLCLEHWLLRAGFQQVKTIYAEPLSTQEQRSTLWAPGKSLADFLNSQDTSLTIEGYPAPHRFYMIAR